MPRRLRAVEECWHELVIVRGHLQVIVRGLVPFPMESQKVTLVDCRVIELPHLWAGSCGAQVLG
jgi:hypothetical protein